MNSGHPENSLLNGILEVLSEENLYAYGLPEMAKALVGLKVALKKELPYNSFSSNRPAPLSTLKRLATTCKAARAKLYELGLALEEPAHQTLSTVITHTHSVFFVSYGVTQEGIDEAEFEESIRKLLIKLNLLHGGPRSNGAFWDRRSNEERSQQEFKERQALLDVVRNRPEETIRLVYQWADKGIGYIQPTSIDAREQIEIFHILKGGAL